MSSAIETIDPQIETLESDCFTGRRGVLLPGYAGRRGFSIEGPCGEQEFFVYDRSHLIRLHDYLGEMLKAWDADPMNPE